MKNKYPRSLFTVQLLAVDLDAVLEVSRLVLPEEAGLQESLNGGEKKKWKKRKHFLMFCCRLEGLRDSGKQLNNNSCEIYELPTFPLGKMGPLMRTLQLSDHLPHFQADTRKCFDISRDRNLWMLELTHGLEERQQKYEFWNSFTQESSNMHSP